MIFFSCSEVIMISFFIAVVLAAAPSSTASRSELKTVPTLRACVQATETGYLSGSVLPSRLQIAADAVERCIGAAKADRDVLRTELDVTLAQLSVERARIDASNRRSPVQISTSSSDPFVQAQLDRARIELMLSLEEPSTAELERLGALYKGHSALIASIDDEIKRADDAKWRFLTAREELLAMVCRGVVTLPPEERSYGSHCASESLSREFIWQ